MKFQWAMKIWLNQSMIIPSSLNFCIICRNQNWVNDFHRKLCIRIINSTYNTVRSASRWWFPMSMTIMLWLMDLNSQVLYNNKMKGAFKLTILTAQINIITTNQIILISYSIKMVVLTLYRVNKMLRTMNLWISLTKSSLLRSHSTYLSLNCNNNSQEWETNSCLKATKYKLECLKEIINKSSF